MTRGSLNSWEPMPPEKRKLADDPFWLNHHHNELYKSTTAMADELGISSVMLRRYFRKHKVPYRTSGQETALRSLGLEKYLKTRDREWLYNEYIINNKSIKKISIESDIPYGTIERALHRFDIPTYSSIMEFDKHVILRNREWLYERYVVQKKDYTDIANELNVANTTVMRYLKINNIKARTPGEALSGELAPNWKGGISFEPYCPKFSRDLKRRIRAFFNDSCVLCGKTTIECGHLMGCHHVEYNKQACCDGKPVHFATLCPRCHGKTNFDRERWQSIIHRIIDEIYAGRSYYTKTEFKEVVK